MSGFIKRPVLAAILPDELKYLDLDHQYYELVEPFTYVSNVYGIIVVPAGSPYASIKALADAAHATPGVVAYGTAGIGSGMHLAAELMLAQLKISMQHVPYKGGNAAQVAMLTGEIPVFFTTPVGMIELHQSGKVRVVAVTTLQRFPKLPDVPTVAETLAPGFNARGWMAAASPRGCRR